MKFLKLFAIASIAFAYSALNVFSQNLNVQLRSQLQYEEYCSNICGYVDSLGNEYALIGTYKGLSIVDVTDPSLPVQVKKIPALNSWPGNTWRETKVRGKYAYVTTEAGGGLQIVNLSSLPDTTGIVYRYWTGDGIIAGQLGTIHTLHIDSNYVYMYGGSWDTISGGGAVVADITDPWNPIYVGKYDEFYIHDAYVRNDTMYGAHIVDGFFSVVDFRNKSNPVTLATQFTPTRFTHNTWLSTDSKTLFTTDENYDGSYLASFDISDLSNIEELDRINATWDSTVNSNSVVHNTHIINVGGNDYAVSAWYRDGFTIVDAGRPHNLVQIGNYDTYPGTGGGYNGAWGVYPYLPSGTIVVSDIEGGLFVFTPTYVRACYLEGTVTDSLTTFPINGAKVEILTTSALEFSKITGDYATGIPAPGGTYDIKYSKPGYYPKIITGINLLPAQVFNQDVALLKKPTHVVNGQVIESISGNAISNANVSFRNSDFNYETTTDINGNFSFPAIYEDIYEIVAGHWGHVTTCGQYQSIDSTTGLITIQMDKGYYDDFTFDFGWQVQSDSTLSKGIWERGIPFGTFDEYTDSVQLNPEKDDSTDCYNIVFVTDNKVVESFAHNNQMLHHGHTTLISPVFDLSNYGDPYVNYTMWYYHYKGAGLALIKDSLARFDSLSIYIDNGITRSLIDFDTSLMEAINSRWVNKSFKITDYISLTSTMKLVIRAHSKHYLMECGFDKFFISGGMLDINEQSFTHSNIQVYPNPFSNEISISYELNTKCGSGTSLIMTDITGREVEVIKLTNQKDIVAINPSVNSGIYFVRIVNGDEVIAPVKIIKLK